MAKGVDRDTAGEESRDERRDAVAHATDSGLVAGANVDMHGRNVAGRDLTINQVVQERAVLASCQLPPDIDDFADRDAELSSAARHLGREPSAAPALVRISGRGGVGKTALATRVAHGLRDKFPQGQLYVNLRGVEAERLDPASVLARFLRALGVESADVPEELEDRVALYRSHLADRQVLVLLDNAADERQVRPLLPASPTCGVLITSRAPLTALGGMHVALDVLDEDSAVELLNSVADREGTGDQAEAAQQIVQLCGRLPLAVRIAGAKLAARPHWALSDLADQLGDERRRLRILKIGDLEVRTSFQVSYQEQEPQLRRCFRLLGLLAAPDFAAWVAAAALDVDVDEAEELVERLCDARLLDFAGRDATRQTRYRFHDLLRDFARERALAEEPEAVRQAVVERVLGGYLALAETADAMLEPGIPNIGRGDGFRWHCADPGLTETLLRDPHAWFLSERPSLVTAVEQASAYGLTDLTWELAGIFAAFFGVRAHWGDWRHTHELALAATRRAGHRRGEVFTLRSLGRLLRYEGRWQDAHDCFSTAKEAFHELGEERWEAITRRNLGDLAREQGALEEALEHYRQALAVFEQLNDQPWIAVTLNSMGELHRLRSEHDEAIDCFKRCRRIFATAGHQWWTAVTLVGMAEACRDQARYEDAIRAFNEGLRIIEDLGDRRWTALTLAGMGNLYNRLECYDDAIDCFGKCLPIFEAIGDRIQIARALRGLGHSLGRKGDVAAQCDAWERARTTFAALGAPEATELAVLLDAVALAQPDRDQRPG